MIRVCSLGGVNEHGRNCFYIQGSKTLLLDCGKGEKGEIPDLDKIEVKQLDYLFLSHSHNDHTGAIKALLDKGFAGTIFLTKPTLDNLNLTYPKIRITRPKEEIRLSNDLKVYSTRSGHCFGSLAYHIEFDNKKILYTGDYLEDSVFSCDKIENEEADLAIIDTAYSDDEKSYSENEEAFLNLLKKENEVLLPLPKNGRSMDVISFLNEAGIPYELLDNFFMEEKDIYLKNDIAIHSSKNAKIRLCLDPQMERKESQEYLKIYPRSALIFTGTIDESSVAETLLKDRKNTFFSRINVHQRIKDAKKLEEKNFFKNVILFHNKNTKERTEIYL